MEGDSAAPVRQNDRRTRKDDPDDTEQKPATCVTNGGGHNENQQQLTSHVTPTCLKDKAATSSFYSGENNNSSTYSDSPPPPLPRRAPMAPCNPSLMRLSSEVEDAQPIPPSRRETHDDDDDDYDIYESCEPSLMTDDAADYVENYETEALQPRTMFKASCEPSRMASFPDLEALEMKTIIHETHAGKDDSRAFGQRRLSADVETARVQAKATSAPALTEARIVSGGWSELASETDPDADKVKVRRTQSTPLLSTINSEQTNSSVDHVDNTTGIEATDFFGKVVERYFGLLDILFVLVFGIVLYVVDVGSDVMAAVVYFQEGHRVWGSLTITFVVASAFCWAAVSWTWWYRDDKDRTKRRMRMMLAVLLLDPLVR